MGCNQQAIGDLPRVAFFRDTLCGILSYMERKPHKNYIREWRLDRGLTQKKLLERLAELAGDNPPDDPALKIPTTEASLSRIETGKQNFSIATLEALAEALDCPQPGWLLDRRPRSGEVVSLFDRMSDSQAEQATSVLKAMFGFA